MKTYSLKGIPEDLLTSDDVGLRRLKVEQGTEKIQRTKAFFNPDFGGAMNQDATFSGTPVLIHDGGDNVGWAAVADVGVWDFADTVDPYSGLACVSIATANNGDSCTFSGATVDGASYTAISIQINLEAYSIDDDSINLQMKLGGADQGTPVNVVDYVNATMLNEYQRVAIPLEDLGVDALTFDEATITVNHSTGPRPSFRFDVFEVEEIGGGVEFTVETDQAGDLSINRIRLSMVNGVTGAIARDYDKLLGIDLFNGLTINRTSGGNVIVGRNLANLYEFYSSGFVEIVRLEGQAETMLIIEIVFDIPLILLAETNDSISFGLSDDYSGFTLMTAIARGFSDKLPI